MVGKRSQHEAFVKFNSICVIGLGASIIISFIFSLAFEAIFELMVFTHKDDRILLNFRILYHSYNIFFIPIDHINCLCTSNLKCFGKENVIFKVALFFFVILGTIFSAFFGLYLNYGILGAWFGFCLAYALGTLINLYNFLELDYDAQLCY